MLSNLRCIPCLREQIVDKTLIFFPSLFPQDKKISVQQTLPRISRRFDYIANDRTGIDIFIFYSYITVSSLSSIPYSSYAPQLISYYWYREILLWSNSEL